MADISIQFYATTPETIDFSREMSLAYDLHVVAMRPLPFQVEEINVSAIANLKIGQGEVCRLLFTCRDPETQVSNALEFDDSNPDRLRLELGVQTECTLSESWLEARTKNKAALVIWKRVASKLKRITKAGLTAVSRETGVSVYYRTGRYTKGAEKLEAAGIAMLPPQGARGPEITLGRNPTT